MLDYEEKNLKSPFERSEDYQAKPCSKFLSVGEKWSHLLQVHSKPSEEKERLEWEEMLAEALREPDRRKRSHLLVELQFKFSNHANKLAKKIIEEIHLAESEKTVKPAPMAGVMGQKFFADNIVFKMVSVDALGMFAEELEVPLKCSGREMLALKAVMKLHLEGKSDIRVPLACKVDWMGHRVLALSHLPVNCQSLVLGQNCGRFVKKANERVKEEVRKTAALLNLKESRTNQGSCHFPVDSEIHFHSQNIFALGLTRLFPSFLSRSQCGPSEHLKHLYAQFRPEFLQIYQHPLSVDSCGAFSDLPTEEERKNAYNFLTEDVIPKFAVSLSSIGGFIGGKRLTRLIHKKGINVCFLGKVSRSIFLFSCLKSFNFFWKRSSRLWTKS